MLRQRGLQVLDEQEALRTLSMVSYFRLACYFRPMDIDKQTHVFRQGATLDQAMELYKFDTALRDLVFGATRQIEVALRSRVNHHFSRSHTPFWFTQVDMATDGHLFTEHLSGSVTP
jgi:abortive infection bacteriophage resistance protein